MNMLTCLEKTAVIAGFMLVCAGCGSAPAGSAATAPEKAVAPQPAAKPETSAAAAKPASPADSEIAKKRLKEAAKEIETAPPTEEVAAPAPSDKNPKKMLRDIDAELRAEVAAGNDLFDQKQFSEAANHYRNALDIIGKSPDPDRLSGLKKEVEEKLAETKGR
jgi:hypothetical protein